ncbi:MAG: PIN domain-containing protein [Halobacteriota archaeon]
MKLVVDTNVLFSFFKKESKTRKLILNFEILEPVTPSFCIDELNEHKELICERSKLSDSEFEEVLDDLLIFVKVFSLSEYKDFLSDAKIISPDPDDIDLFALALKLECPIWAQEKAFKKQQVVKVFSTSDLISFLSRTRP